MGMGGQMGIIVVRHTAWVTQGTLVGCQQVLLPPNHTSAIRTYCATPKGSRTLAHRRPYDRLSVPRRTTVGSWGATRRFNTHHAHRPKLHTPDNISIQPYTYTYQRRCPHKYDHDRHRLTGNHWHVHVPTYQLHAQGVVLSSRKPSRCCPISSAPHQGCTVGAFVYS